MSRLIIVDQSLKGLGGHHFDYTLQIARAAASRQCEVVVATNRKFRGCSRLDHFARLYPVFRNTTYSRFSLLAGLRAMFGRGPLELGQKNPRQLPLSIESQLDQPTDPQGSSFSDRQKRYWKQVKQRWDRKWTYVRESAGRNRVVKSFAADCQQLFRMIGLTENDHVFFPTISDLDLAGLLTYWMGNPESHRPVWHMQFHFDVFVGRAPDYRKQMNNVGPLRDLFEDIEHAVPSYQLNYYATTDSIADQYQRLSSRQINELAYPVSEGFVFHPRKTSPLRVVSPHGLELPDSSEDFPTEGCGADSEEPGEIVSIQGDSFDTIGLTLNADRIGNTSVESHNFGEHGKELRPMVDGSFPGIPVVVAGGIREEKGQACLASLLPEMQRTLFSENLGFLVCQRKIKTRWWKKPAFRFGCQESPGEEKNPWDDSICYLPHPLEPKLYQKMIRQTGIGLLAYDRESYASRRAGIFGEYLGAGIPVIVPSGTWMADQLEPAQQNHLRRARQQAEVTHHWRFQQLDWADWNVPSASGVISFDGQEVPAYAWSPEFEDQGVSDVFRHVSVRFGWQWPREKGTYCRVQLLFHSAENEVLGSASYVVGRWSEDCQCEVLFEIPPGTTSLRVGFSNAYHERNASINNLVVELLEAETAIPRGAIGLSFDGSEQIPDLLREMCVQHSHYQQAAAAHARTWYEGHDPLLTVTQLMSSSQAARSWAA